MPTKRPLKSVYRLQVPVGGMDTTFTVKSQEEFDDQLELLLEEVAANLDHTLSLISGPELRQQPDQEDHQ